MAKTFYTERDIEDLFRSGTRSLTVGEDVVLTDLAYEKAKQLGMALVQPTDTPPAAPIRPYLSQPQTSQRPTAQSAASNVQDIKQRVRQAVLARLGEQVDLALVDKIIERVARDIGLE